MARPCPGPWEVVKESHSYNHAVFGPGPKDIIAHVIDSSFPDDVVTANAKLIGSAPKLLAALKRLVDQAELTDDFAESEHSTLRTAVRQAREAIKEASEASITQ